MEHLNAVVAVSAKGNVLARRTFDNTADGFKELRALGRQWRERTWAIEGCNGVGKHLSQRLLAAGERVADVSTRRAALVRVYLEGNGRKNDDTDAYSIAMVALHTPDLPEVIADHIRDLEYWDRKIAAIDTQLVELVDDTPTSLRDLYVLPSASLRS